MRRLFFFLSLALVSALGVFWVRWGVPRLEKRLHARIQASLTSILHRPVHLDGVKLHPLFLAVTLENLRVAAAEGPDAPVLFACRRWTLFLTLLHRDEKFPWISISFGQSHVEVPVLRLDALPAFAPKRRGFAFLSLLPAHRLQWEGGSIHFPAIKNIPSFTLSDAAGSAVLSSGNASLEVRGGTPWGPVNAAARIDEPIFRRAKSPEWKTVVLFTDAKLESLVPFLPAPPPGEWKGSAEITLTMEGRVPAPPVERWSLGIAFKEASWTLDRRPWPLAGRLTVSPEKIEWDASTLDRRLSVKGGMEAPFHPEARLDFSLKAAALDLDELSGRLPHSFLSSVPWRGQIDGVLTVKGPRARPDVHLDLDARDAGAGPLLIPRLRASLDTTADRFVLDAALAEGSLHASAPRPGRGLPEEGEIHLENLSLETLARAGGWGQVGGVLGGDFALRLSSASATPLAGGVLRLARPAWGDHRLEEPLIAYFSWRDGAARFHNKDGTFDVSVRRDADGWTVPQLVYARADGLSLQGAGVIAGAENDMDFHATLRQASLRDLPFLLERYPDLEGRWQAELTLKGPFARPEASLSFEGSDARLRATAPFHVFKGKIHGGSGALALEDFSFDEVWKASALRLSDGTWQVAAGVQGGDAAVFSEISLSSTPVSGRLSARLTAGGGGDTPWEGALQASASGARWGDVALSSAAIRVQWDKDLIRLDDFSVAPGSAPFAYQGEARRLTGEDWRFFLTGPFVEKAEGLARLHGPLLSLAGVSFGDGLTADARADFSARTLEARFAAKEVPSEAVSRRAGVAWPSTLGGKLNGTLLLAGPLLSPAYWIEARWSDAAWGDVPLKGSLRGHGGEGLFSLEEAWVESPGNGRAAIRGSLPTKGAEPWSLAWEARDLPLRLLGPLMKGSFEGGGRVEGTRFDPESSFSLRAADARIGEGSPFSASLEGSYKDRAVVVKKGEASGGEGQWRLRPGASLHVLSNGFSFETVNDIRNVQAGPLSLFGGLHLSGQWTPGVLSMVLTAEDLWVNQQSMDRELARIIWSRGRLSFDPPPGAAQRITGAVDLGGFPKMIFDDVSLWDGPDRRLHLEGEAGPDLWRFSLEGHGLEAGTLLSLADLDVTGEGAVDALLTGRGSGKDPQVEAEVLGSHGNVEGIPYDRLAVTLLWAGRRIELRNLEASRRRGYALTGRGEFHPSEDPDAPLRAALSLRLTEGNLALLKDLWPDCRQAKGSFQGEFTVAPGKEGTVTSGFFSLEDGSFKSDKYVRSVKDLTVKLRLRDNRVRLEDVSGRAGKGRFVMAGDVGLDGFRIKDYDVSLRTIGRRGIPVEVPQLAVPPGPILKTFSILRRGLEAASQGSPRLDITVKGPHGGHVIAGEVILDDTHFTYPPSKDAFKGLDRTSWWGEFWREAAWDVRLKTGRDTWYRNEFVNVHVNGLVAVQGTRGALRVDGKVSSDQGLISYLSQSFEVKKALLDLATDDRPGVSQGGVTAYLSGEAEKNATTLDNRGLASLDVITMIVPRAPLGEIRPRFVSRNNAGLSSERVFQKMMGFSAQDPLQPPTADEQDQLLRAGLVQLVGASAGPFANRLAHLFGIDMISAIYEPTAPTGDVGRTPDTAGTSRLVDPATGRLTNRWANLLHGAGASAGVQLSDRLFGLYKFKVDQTVRNQTYFHDEVQVVGRLRGNLYFKFSSELDARSLLGQPPNRQALLEQQWRFGLPRRKPKKTSPERNDDKQP